MDSHKLLFPLEPHKEKIEHGLDITEEKPKDKKERKKRKLRLNEVFSGVKQNKKK